MSRLGSWGHQSPILAAWAPRVGLVPGTVSWGRDPTWHNEDFVWSHWCPVSR